MWEALQTLPYGRISVRSIISFATSILVATFVYLLTMTTPVAAATTTAEWSDDGSSITYSPDGVNDYSYSDPKTVDAVDGISKYLDTGSRYFTAVTTPHADKTIREDCTYNFIYFAPSANYLTAPKASHISFFEKNCNSAKVFDDAPTGQSTINITPQNAAFTGPDSPSTCQVDGVGWLVCSMSTWIAEGMDYLFEVLKGFFVVTPITGSRGGLHEIWKVALGFANAAFVIVGLIIIYSLITGNMMNNYSIKRMMPRLLVGALLVNTSYIICALAVDISNILGVELQNLLISIRNSSGAANVDFPLWKDITAAILGGGAITIGGGAALIAASGGTAAGLLWLLLGAMIPAIFAALVAVMILAARQALIVIFVAIAPLAFVMYLLPNTEEWFHRWRKAFTTLLVMFPAFSILFGGSQLAGLVILQNANGSIVVAMLGLAVQVVPLFITPFLIKLSSGLMGTIAGMVNNKQKGIFDRTKNWTDENRKMHQQRGLARRNRDGSVKRSGFGSFLLREGTTGAAQAMERRRERRKRLTGAYTKDFQANFESHATGREAVMAEKSAEARTSRAAAANELAWEQRLAGHASAGGRTQRAQRRNTREYARLNHALTDTHVDKGLAKVLEENHHSHAEHQLQQTIQNPAGSYRNVKINTKVTDGLAKVYESDYEAQAKYTLEQTIQNPAGAYRGMAVNAATLQGLAKNYESEYQAAAERHVQQAISNAAGAHRAIKLQADIAKQEAGFLQTNVETEAKTLFKRQFADGGAGSATLGMTARELRQMNVATSNFEKEAADREAILQNRAEADWNRRSHTSGEVARELLLSKTSSADSKKLEENKAQTFIESIRADGDTAAAINPNETVVASAIRHQTDSLRYEDERQDSFKIKQQANQAKVLRDDSTIRTYAGGDTDSGAARVYAKAKSAMSSAFMETVKNNRSVISDYNTNELMRLAVDGQKRTKDAAGNIAWVAATEEEQMAAYQEVLLNKGNNWSIQKLKDKVSEEGMVYDETTGQYYATEADLAAGINALGDDEVENRRTKQQIFVDALKQSKLSIASVSGSDKSDMESGLFRFDGQSAIIRDIKQKKIKEDRWVSTDMDELQRMIQIFRDDSVREDLAQNNPDSLQRIIDTINHSLTDERISRQIDGRNQDLMKVIKQYALNTQAMSQAEKQSIENLAATKVPTDYDPNRMYDRSTPTGP